MSILDDDIMHIDAATGIFTVSFHNLRGIKRVLRVPGYPDYPSTLSPLTSCIKDNYPAKVTDSIKKYLEKIPIMRLTDARIENICRGHVIDQHRCQFFGPGHPQQLDHDNDHHWELIYRASKYSKPGSIAVYPLYDENGGTHYEDKQ